MLDRIGYKLLNKEKELNKLGSCEFIKKYNKYIAHDLLIHVIEGKEIPDYIKEVKSSPIIKDTSYQFLDKMSMNM